MPERHNARVRQPFSHPPDEYFPSLVGYLRHLVDRHDVEETPELWRTGRDGFDRLHAAAHGDDDCPGCAGMARLPLPCTTCGRSA